MLSLNSKENRVVWMNALFTLGSSLGSVFVNVYVYEYTRSFQLTVLYAFVRYIFIPVFSFLAGKLSRHKDLTHIVTLGLLLIIASYLALLIIGSGIDGAIWKAYIIAGVTGCGEGLFWFAMNVMNQNTARVETRGRFLSNIGTFNGLANIGAPLISAIILRYSVTEMFGYSIIFSVVIAIFVVVTIVCTRLSYQYRTPEFQVLDLFKKGSIKWEYQKITTLYNALREVFVLALSGLIIYRLLNGSGELLSIYNAFASVLLIIGYRLVGRYIQNNMVITAFYIGSVGLVLAVLILAFGSNYSAVVLYGLLTAVATPLYAMGYQMIRMKIYSEETKNDNITGHIIVVEMIICLGRLTSLGLVIVLSLVLKDPDYIGIASLLMAAGGLMIVGSTYRLSKKAELI